MVFCVTAAPEPDLAQIRRTSQSGKLLIRVHEGYKQQSRTHDNGNAKGNQGRIFQKASVHPCLRARKRFILSAARVGRWFLEVKVSEPQSGQNAVGRSRYLGRRWGFASSSSRAVAPTERRPPQKGGRALSVLLIPDRSPAEGQRRPSPRSPRLSATSALPPPAHTVHRLQSLPPTAPCA
jgi:hypothetical protein